MEVNKFATARIHQTGQLLQLLSADALGEEGNDVLDPALVHPQDFQRIADKVQLALGHLVGIEDVRLGSEAVWKHQFRRLLPYGAADEAGNLALPVVHTQGQAPSVATGRGVAALEGGEGLGGEGKRGQGSVRRVEPLSVGLRVEARLTCGGWGNRGTLLANCSSTGTSTLYCTVPVE